MTADWVAPPRTDAPTVTAPVPWVIDRDPRDNEDGVRIYAVTGANASIRLVAKELHPEDAELIVTLYDAYRNAS